MPLVKFFLSILKLYFTWKENKQLYFKYTSKYGHYNYTVFYSNWGKLKDLFSTLLVNVVYF